MRKQIFILCFVQLLSFSCGDEVYNPEKELFMGVTLVGGLKGGGAIFTMDLDGTNYNTIYSLDSATEGDELWGSLHFSNDGYAYGATHQGGQFGKGTFFRIKPNGENFLVLKHLNSLEGGNAGGYLIEDSGKLLGLRNSGGLFNIGNVFSISKTGEDFHVLHSFTPDGLGGFAQGSLLLKNEMLYGMVRRTESQNSGGIFSLSTSGGNPQTLHEFGELNDGEEPFGSLMDGLDGFLYGMASNGGSRYEGEVFTGGVIFKIKPDGTEYTILKHLKPSLDGRRPMGDLFIHENTLYGMTTAGGEFNSGTIFSIKPDGSDFKKLHDFNENTILGGPRGRLEVGSDGFFYGLAWSGGNFGSGYIFKIKPNGENFQVVRHLDRETDGANPRGHLIKIKL